MINSNVFDYVNVLDKAADASWKREQLIANNIANQDTPGYKRQDIDFEGQLQRALRESRFSKTIDEKVSDIKLNRLNARQYTDYGDFSYRLDENNVDPEQEQVMLAANQLKYEGLMNSLTEEFAKYGVEFVSISIADMDAGEALEKAISDEAVAKKAVETAEQNLKKAEIDAKQQSVQAQAEQDAAKIKAETMKIEAQAQKEANELLNFSLSNLILKQQWIEKWDGKLPTYYGGDSTMMIGMD